MKRPWIDITVEQPTTEGYYTVKFSNEIEDRKYYRIRPKQNILGFMTEETVTHWKRK